MPQLRYKVVNQKQKMAFRLAKDGLWIAWRPSFVCHSVISIRLPSGPSTQLS